MIRQSFLQHVYCYHMALTVAAAVVAEVEAAAAVAVGEHKSSSRLVVTVIAAAH